jgi:hypothetical protein
MSRVARAALISLVVVSLAQGQSVPDGPAIAGPPAVLEGVFERFPQTPLSVPSPELKWPGRLGHERATATEIMGICVDVKQPIARPVPQQVGDAPMLVESGFYPAIDQIWKLHRPGLPLPLVRFEGRNSCVVALPAPREAADTRKAKKPFVSLMTFEFVSVLPLQEGQEERVPGEAVTVVVPQRTAFSLFDSKAENSRGLVVLMPGLLGTPPSVVQALTEALCKDGWSVLRMWAQPSRFTESIDVPMNLAESGGEREIRQLASDVEALLRERLAECAYAVQAACAHVEDVYPAFKGLPRVAIGFSGGALTLPTVVAREPERYSAAVLVGGAANAFLLTLKTNYSFVGGPQYKFAQPASAEFIDAVNLAYLEQASLDAYHTAPTLKDKRLLFIHANADLAVPSPLGEVLWERSGRPRRVIRESGHEDLFNRLVRDFPKILRFLRAEPDPAP